MTKTTTITKKEEQLYNQFMAELEEGANEYDSMMAEGNAPAFWIRQAHPLQLCWLARQEPKASKPKTTILSMVRWTAVAACFVGVFIGGASYFINDNTDAQQLATVDHSRRKVLSVKENNVTKGERIVADNNIATLHAEMNNAKRINRKKGIDGKAEDNYVCVLPEIILNVPSAKVENGNYAQYPSIRKEYDFDVICYNVLPEISDGDNKAIASADLEIKQICDNIYYNDVKPIKH